LRLSKFNVFQDSLKDARPLVSHKFRDYFIDIITIELSEEKNILLNANWNVILSITFLCKGIYGPDSLLPAKGSRTVSAGTTKK
jgi:hypothetical protein